MESWVCMGSKGDGFLTIVDERLNSQQLIELLENSMTPNTRLISSI